MDLGSKRVLVVGLAQTGIAVARFCAARGAHVTVTDSSSPDRLRDQIDALGGVAEMELGGHRRETFTGADLIVMSPGVPEIAETRAARAAGVEVIAEIELAYRFLHPDACLVAITGTNGKSTTTALAGALCAASGRPAFCGGNLGNSPLIEAVDHPANVPGGYVVAEVAGFMLETCTSFRPKVAACLNITEDHLDRYGTMEVYASMKTRVYNWQTESDFAIANAACPRTLAGAVAARGKLMLFDSSRGTDRRDVDARATRPPIWR
jgi:UDP-N-acetylmuramoylalanine--D-glutamate ligase